MTPMRKIKKMNKHNIEASNYQNSFVLVLAKSGSRILADWLQADPSAIVGDSYFAKVTNHLHLWHMSTGLTGEALEYFEVKNMSVPDSTPQEELGDALFYAIGMAKYIGIEDWTDFAFMNEDHCDDMQYLLSAMVLDDKMKRYNIYNDEEKLEEVKVAWVQFMVNWSSKAAEVFAILQDAIDNNVNKLSKRYDGIVYSNEAAKNRADKIEEGELDSDQDSEIDPFPSGT